MARGLRAGGSHAGQAEGRRPALARYRGALPGSLREVRQRLAAYSDGDRQFVTILSAVPEAGLEAVDAACAAALTARLHSADAVLNLLARGREPELPPLVLTPSSLTLGLVPTADCARYGGLRTVVAA